MSKHQRTTQGLIRIQPKQPIQTKNHEGIRNKATGNQRTPKDQRIKWRNNNKLEKYQHAIQIQIDCIESIYISPEVKENSLSRTTIEKMNYTEQHKSQTKRTIKIRQGRAQ